MFSLLLSGMTQAATTDVTSPGDAIKGYPDDGDWPSAQAPSKAIDDNTGTKYLHFKGDFDPDPGTGGTGFRVTASLGGMAVTGMTFTTAGDCAGRDPIAFELSGSNGTIDGPYELIYSGDIVDFSQATEWPRNTKNETPISFDNVVGYAHYQVLFTAIRGPVGGCVNSMQVSEVELLTDVTPPAGWSCKDIGNPAIPGSVDDDAGTWTVQGSGHDIWDNGDGFYYVFRPLSGDDGSLELNLISADNTNANGWSKVGLMIRETTQAGSKHAMMAMTGTNGLQFVWRENTNDSSDGSVRPAYSPPKFLRITRAGDEMIGEFGEEKPWNPGVIVWTEVDRKTIMMNSDVYIGVAVCAGNNDALNTAVLDQMNLITPPYEKVWDMSPEDGATDVSLTPTLSWMPGDGALSHDVYLSSNPDDMGEPVNTTATSYTPDTPLLGSTTYYWQVVEQPGVEGPVYRFKTRYDAPWWTGTLNWEQWLGMPWQEVQRMVDGKNYLLMPPNNVDEKTDAYCGPDTPVEDYGVRMSGHLIPGTSGDYTFWIAADDGCRLRLNTDNDVADLVKIAGFYRYSGNFDHWPDQKSDPIYLEAGQKYAIEILLKEAGGGDWVEVAWEGGPGSDAPSRTRITGTFLTSAYAVNARPEIRSTITPLEAETLSWTAGKFATSQDVLFGTDPAAMVSITPTPLSADPAVLVERTTLAMPAVASGNTYYWQVNSTDGTETWEGDVWSFEVSDWVGRDIGIHQIAENQPEPPAGSSWVEDGITVINAGGHELWGDWDPFHYRYTTVKMVHDIGTIQARVLSITDTTDWTRAGVMIREGLYGSSRMVMMHKTGHDNTRMQYRQEWRWGKGSGPDNWGLGFPTWVRIERDGDRFDGYYSLDGENWIHRGTVYIPMEPDKPVYIGLVSSHNPRLDQSTLTTATFDNFSYTTPDPRKAWNLNPPNGSTMMNIHTTLTWGAGEGVTEHYVYFSKDEEAVVNRDPAVQTILPAETTELYVGPLDLTQTYYWCVDEVVNPVIPGDVVSFTVEPYRLIEDFESYDVGPEPLPEQIVSPGDILVEAVEPPDNTWVEQQIFVEAVAPDEGCLVSRWEFDGDYTDSKSGFDGTPNGGVSLITDDPERGNVASFDGVDGYVDCGNPDELNFGTNDWSVCAWVKTTYRGPDDNGKPKGVLYGNGGDGGGGIRYTLGVGESKSDRVTLTADDDGNPPGSEYGKRNTHGSTHVTDGVWHHVIGVREGDRIRIYTDGNLEDDDSLKGDDFDLTGIDQHNALLGAIWHHSHDQIEKFYTGLIDDVRVYNCALSLGNARYMSGLGSLIKPGYYGPLIAHYAFDEGSGDTAVDSTDNNLDGVISGAVYTTDTADGSASCLDFNGFGDNVLNLDAGPYLNNLDKLSISLWVKSDLIDTDKGFFMGGDTASDRWGMRYDAAGGDGGGDDVIKYGVNTTDDNEEDESSELLQTTEWQHLVMSWQSGAGLKLYVNGVLNVPTSDKGPVSGVTEGYNRLLVGKGSKDGDADASWDGLIDDVRVYARALSEGEARYLAGVGDLVADVYHPLIAHYKVETDASDSSGNDFHGTPLGDATLVYDDERGVVGSFDGDGDAVDIGNSELFNFTDDFSISAWVNLRSMPGCWGSVIVGKRGEGGVGWQLREFGCDNRFSFTTRGTGGDDYPRSNLVPEMNKWYHLAAIRDGGQKRLYINGVLDSTQGINLNPVNACSHNVYIGARANGGNTGPESFFDGMIDELRIYNTALTLGQVRELAGYESTKDIGDTWSGRAAAAPALEYQEPAHGGSQSMRVDYTGDGAVKRLEPFGDGAHPHGWNGDFSLGRAQALSLWFRGDTGNAPGTMFAQLTTVVPSVHTQRVVYDGDPEDLMNPKWQEWNISLKALSTGKPFDPPLPEEGLPVTKIEYVGIGIIGGGGGVLYFDDLRLQPVRCVPKYGPLADLTDDCFVDIEDLRVLADEWLVETQFQEWDRVAYWDSRYRTNWAPHETSVAMRDALSAAGYTVVDADELKTWMDARIADRALSVVVMCRDNTPDTIVESVDTNCTLRRYLDAGGKVVFYADIPLYDIGHNDGTWDNPALSGQENILGISQGMRWDSWNTATITPTGADWGLTQTWSSLRATTDTAGLTVLATDDEGNAAAWAKHYVSGDKYRGFVRLYDQASPSVNFDDVMLVAEYIAELTADLYEDDAINFLDYADLLNHFGEEELFPAPGDQL